MIVSRFILFFALLATAASGQSFEGTIKFRTVVSKDTTLNIYYVKGNAVKLDRLGAKSGKTEGSLLFDLSANTVRSIQPSNKIWMEQTVSSPAPLDENYVVAIDKKTKKILGKECQEYTVTNAKENIQISYWITVDNYDFYVPMARLFTGKQRLAVYFNQIKSLPQGAMIMSCTEQDLSNHKILRRMEITAIQPSKVDAAFFQIPADFMQLESIGGE